jgi:hypothetical protein
MKGTDINFSASIINLRKHLLQGGCFPVLAQVGFNQLHSLCRFLYIVHP